MGRAGWEGLEGLVSGQAGCAVMLCLPPVSRYLHRITSQVRSDLGTRMVPALPGFASWGRKGHYTPPRALSGGPGGGPVGGELKGGRELGAAPQLPSGRGRRSSAAKAVILYWW